MRKTATLSFIFFFFLCTSLAKSPKLDTVADFNNLVDKYFDSYFQLNPTNATSAGFHQHDNELEDYSAAGRERETREQKEFLGKFQQVDRSKLPPDTAADLDWVISSIHSELLELENIQMWRKDPDSYTSGVTNSIFLIMKREYAPPEERPRFAIQR